MPYCEQQLRICSRTGDIIEPMIKKQWFLDCASMNDRALRAIERGLVCHLFTFKAVLNSYF